MSKVDVSTRVSGNGWVCDVVLEYGGETHHLVRVSRADLARLAPGSSDPVNLVRASFAFLLEREPPGSILREFDLAVIGQYFPEYEAEIARRMRNERRLRASAG